MMVIINAQEDFEMFLEDNLYDVKYINLIEIFILSDSRLSIKYQTRTLKWYEWIIKNLNYDAWLMLIKKIHSFKIYQIVIKMEKYNPVDENNVIYPLSRYISETILPRLFDGITAKFCSVAMGILSNFCVNRVDTFSYSVNSYKTISVECIQRLLNLCNDCLIKNVILTFYPSIDFILKTISEFPNLRYKFLNRLEELIIIYRI